MPEGGNPRFITAAEVADNYEPIGGGGGSPGGSDKDVQFNDSNAFGGDTGITFNKTTKTLSLKAGVGGPGDVLDVYDSNNVLIGSLYVDETLFGQFRISAGPGAQAVNITVSTSGARVSVSNGVQGVIIDSEGSVTCYPMVDPPASPTEGMIYADTDHHLYYYNGTTWKQLDN